MKDLFKTTELWFGALVISAAALYLSINIHLRWHPTNGEGIQFAGIYLKLFCFIVLLTSTIKQNQCGGTHRVAAGRWWILPPLLQQQISPRTMSYEHDRVTGNMHGYRPPVSRAETLSYAVPDQGQGLWPPPPPAPTPPSAAADKSRLPSLPLGLLTLQTKAEHKPNCASAGLKLKLYFSKTRYRGWFWKQNVKIWNHSQGRQPWLARFGIEDRWQSDIGQNSKRSVTLGSKPLVLN